MSTANDGLLIATLGCAVPLWIEKVRSWPESQRIARAHECAQIIAEHGDKILFKQKATKKFPIGSAEAFNALAESIAIASFYPGGIKIFGQQWETV